jgi:hypothetical protein
MKLEKKLENWTDLDVALYLIASGLGIIDEDKFAENKYLYWTNNKYNEFFLNTVENMIELEILEVNRDENLIRFNKNFKIV